MREVENGRRKKIICLGIYIRNCWICWSSCYNNLSNTFGKLIFLFSFFYFLDFALTTYKFFTYNCFRCNPVADIIWDKTSYGYIFWRLFGFGIIIYLLKYIKIKKIILIILIIFYIITCYWDLTL